MRIGICMTRALHYSSYINSMISTCAVTTYLMKVKTVAIMRQAVSVSMNKMRVTTRKVCMTQVLFNILHGNTLTDGADLFEEISVSDQVIGDFSPFPSKAFFLSSQ